MARDIKLDDYGDLDISTGDFEFVEDEAECAQIAETKLLKVFDEDVYAQEKGVDWFRKMYDFDRDAKFKTLLLKAALLEIPEVTGIPQLDMELDTETGQASITVTIDSIYSDEPIQVGQ